MLVTFDHAEDTAMRIKTFWFRPDKPVRYVAGQFTEIRLPHHAVDERGDKRWFTLSSSPTDSLLSITTKFTSEQGSSFKRALAALQPGTKLTLAEPMGDFVLPQDASIPLLFVAAGLGITPVHSMIKWLHATGQQRSVQLIYKTATSDELAFRDLFESYSMQFTPVLTTPPPGWTGETGPLTPERILKSANDPRTLIYLSGPEVMVERLVKELPQRGLPSHRLVTDYFHGYPVI